MEKENELPPYSSTGVVNSVVVKMVLGNEVALSKKVSVSVDWIAFTVFNLDTVSEIIEFLGYSSTDFVDMPKGGNGYKNMTKLTSHSLFILYNGNEEMGMHVSISGSAIADCLFHFQARLKCSAPFGSEAYEVSEIGNTAMIEFLSQIRRLGQLSRLDLAIDDLFGSYYSTADLIGILEDKRCISKFRKYKNLLESTLSGDLVGHTVYLGSRSSDIMLRVYDKKLEQNAKLLAREEPLLDHEWVRWELECKNGRANRVADILISGQNLGFIVASILNNYFRVIELDNQNRSRCSISEKWLCFLDTVSKIGLYLVRTKRTLKDKRQWIIKQVLPTLTGVILADGGALNIIVDNMETSINRMSNEILEILAEHNPHWINCVPA